MNDGQALIHSPAGVLAALTAVAAFWFWFQKKSGWKLFDFIPPLIFIYITPVVLNNTGVLTAKSEVYGAFRDFGLPMFIVLLLVGINIGATVRIMGKGVLVMLLGTLGIMVGGPLAYLIVHRWLAPEAWSGFGALAGSWIGGTGNMAAVAGAIGTPPEQFGLAVLADNAVYVVWLPILLGSKAFAERFNRWARVPADRIAKMEAAAAEVETNERPPAMPDYLYLGALASGVTWLASLAAPYMPTFAIDGQAVLSESTWHILLITTAGILLSFTAARRIPGSHNLAMALVYLFVARMGAVASLEGLDQAPAFLLGAFIWIFIHGAFCVFGAWLLRVDLHSAAIASAANVGAAASAPLVAAAHRESLVPVSILMALLGYAIGNYAAIITANLCRFIVGG